MEDLEERLDQDVFQINSCMYNIRFQIYVVRRQSKRLYKDELNGINSKGNDLKAHVYVRLVVGIIKSYEKVKPCNLNPYHGFCNTIPWFIRPYVFLYYGNHRT